MEIQEEKGKTLHAKERVFSIVLKSKSAIKTASLDTNGTNEVLIEGSLGALKTARFLDEQILEMFGTLGVLRVDLASEEVLGNQHATARSHGDEEKN